jgi:hypothetical protein
VQGRKGMKRIVLALTICVASLLAFGGGNALACELGVAPNNARAGDQVTYTVSNCQAGDTWEIKLIYPGTGDDGNPTTLVRRVGASGEAPNGDPFTDTFLVPDLGGDSVDTTVRLDYKDINGTEQPPVDLEGSLGLTYLGQALPTGPTGPTTPSGATGPLDTTPALVPVPTVTRQEAQKKAKKEAVKKKKSSSGKSKSKSKSKSKKHSGSSNPTSTPTTPAPTTPTYTPPVTTPAPVTPSSDLTPPTTPDPPAIPPGIQGPGGVTPPAPTTPTPTAPAPDLPSTAVPVAPVAAAGGDTNSPPVPVWLMILLGLVALLGLGGAQARLLGLWGPPLPLNGRDTSDARLLALQRVSQSGASFQKRIAELKKAAREREPVG